MTRYVYISHSALSHHGILGQKWGKKNGPPYPLDPSDHSAAEKKANNGRYSQGVTQDRGKKKKEPMSDEKKKKIKRAIAIGAGVAGAAALTAGGVYLAKHPETAKAALSGVKDLAVNGVKSLKSAKAIKSISNKEVRDASLKNLKAFNKNKKSDIFGKIKSANAIDRDNNLLKKWDRQYKRQDKKGILSGTDISNKQTLENKVLERPERLFKNKDSIIKTHGQKAYDDLASSVARRSNSDRVASREYQNYKDNKGIKGAAKKVWAPVAATAGVIGTVGGVAGKISGGINSVAGLANNKNVRKLYNDFMYDPSYYEEDTRQQGNGQQQSKKKKRN